MKNQVPSPFSEGGRLGRGLRVGLHGFFPPLLSPPEAEERLGY